MDFKQLTFFCAVAETRNISLAAKRLGVSQPYVSKIIAQLEDELGCRLYDYAGRSIVLRQHRTTA